MATSKPLPCWCGNMPERDPRSDRRYGCLNHPTSNPRLDHITNMFTLAYYPGGRKPPLDVLIDGWNEKVTKHNEIERKKEGRKCSCGKRIYDSFNFCPNCGKAVTRDGD